MAVGLPSIASAGVRLIPDVTGFGTAVAAEVGTALGRAGRSAATLGLSLTRNLTLPVLAVATAITTVGLEFEANIAKIQGLVGIVGEDLEKLRQGVLDIGPAVGKGPGELSDALFFITSAGITDTVKALAILEGSAKASTAGLGTTADVADALTSAVNAYGSQSLSAAEATDVLIETVRLGKVTTDELVGSLGRVIPVASNLGVSFNEVGAAIASMTRTGLDAREATTALRQLLVAIQKPSQEARGVLNEFGISVEELRRVTRDEGLLEALVLMSDTFGDNEEALTRVVPNVRALTGVLSLVGPNVEQTKFVFKELSDVTGALDRSFAAAANTGKFRLAAAFADVRETFARLADQVAPVVVGLGVALAGLATSIDLIPEPLQGIVVGAFGFAAVVGPLIFALAKLKAAFIALRAFGFTGIGVNLIDLKEGFARFASSGVGVATVALIAGSIALKAWFDAASKRKQIITDLEASIDDLTGAYTENTEAILLNQILDAKIGNQLKTAGITVRELIEAYEEGPEAIEGLRTSFVRVVEATAQSDAAAASLIKNFDRLFRRLEDGEEAFLLAKELLEGTNDGTAAADRSLVQLHGNFESFIAAVKASQQELFELPRAFVDLHRGVNDVRLPLSAFTGSMRETSSIVGSAARELQVLEAAQRGVISALKASTDPVFAALNALMRYQELLFDLPAEGERTIAQQLELAEANIEAQAAFDALDPRNYEAAMATIAASLGTTVEELEANLGDLGVVRDEFNQLGPDIEAGLSAGLQGMGDRLSPIMRQEMLKLVNAARLAIGSQSPSTVFRTEVGLTIPQGIAKGIYDGEGLPVKAMRDLLDSVRKEAVAGLNSLFSAVRSSFRFDDATTGLLAAQEQVQELETALFDLPTAIATAQSELAAAQAGAMEGIFEVPDVRDANAGVRDAAESVADALERLTAAQQGVIDAEANQAVAISDLAAAEGELAAAQGDLDANAAKDASSIAALEDKLVRLRLAYLRGDASASDLTDAENDLRAAVDLAAGRVDRLEDAEKAVAKAHDVAAKATLAATKADKDLEAARIRVRNANEDLIRSQERLKDTIDKVVAANEDVIRASELLEKLQGLQETGAGDLAAAQDELRDAELTLLEAQEDLIQSGSDIIGQGPEVETAFRELARAAGIPEEAIQGLIDTYSLVRTEAETFASTTVPVTAAAIAAVIETINVALGGGATKTVGFQGPLWRKVGDEIGKNVVAGVSAQAILNQMDYHGRRVEEAFEGGVTSRFGGFNGRLYTVFTKEVDSALAKIYAHYRIDSPSKVWADRLGGPMGEGVLVGASSALGPLAAVVRTAIDEAEAAAVFNPGSFTLPALGKVSPIEVPVVFRTTDGAEGQVPVIVHAYLDADIEMDGEVVGRAVGRSIVDNIRVQTGART